VKGQFHLATYSAAWQSNITEKRVITIKPSRKKTLLTIDVETQFRLTVEKWEKTEHWVTVNIRVNTARTISKKSQIYGEIESSKRGRS